VARQRLRLGRIRTPNGPVMAPRPRHDLTPVRTSRIVRTQLV
jgi:hypothetical protein